MKAVGVIAEYNPFHLGHAYHLERTREACPGRPVVAVMSGDYVQRGEAAVYNKHERARAAVLSGADLVLELPLPWALSSAEGFARGAVGLLEALGVVDRLSFGSECGDMDKLQKIAEALDSPELDADISGHLKSGVSYAAARHGALEKMLGKQARLAESPNNILGIEYLRAIRALDAPITAVTVTRTGAGHDERGTEAVRSASEIRSIIRTGEDWSVFVPETVYDALGGLSPLDSAMAMCAQLSRLRMLPPEVIARCPECSEGLENRICAALETEPTLEDVLNSVKTRRYTMARLRRILLCAALGVERDMNSGVPPYARVLAANADGLRLLAEIRDTSGIPIVTKPAHGLRLEGRAGECFRLTARARALWSLARPGCPPDSDLRTPPFILK
ncbi:MAG: nucleotidyltransferase family protein [Candidatus Heteroscillospira sp.]